MNEEIEYAEMLEIPVSTVNVVRKKRAKKRKNDAASVAQSMRKSYETAISGNVAAGEAEPKTPDLKQSVIEQVNDKLQEGEPTPSAITAEADLFAESANSEGSLDFNDIPERIDTVRLYSEGERPLFFDDGDGSSLHPYEYDLADENLENEGGRYALKHETRAQKRVRFLLGAEFAAACVFCGGIFLTNIFMPNSAINTFFRALDSNTASAIDERTYSDFALSSVVGAFSDTELTLSETGVLSFTDECHIYPVADGKVSEITQNADGTYQLKISHSDSFSGVIGGLNQVYYAVGEEVKANVPVGYSLGETEVQVTMYSEGELLNCFELTEENCLAWLVQE